MCITASDYFRPYTSLDVTGVEIAGALKNVIAISSGLIAELGFGDNSLASLITRGLAEIKRFGLFFHANPQTFQGLAGIGDLIATATSKHSRNRTAGQLLAAGKSLAEIEHSTGMIIEGFYAIQIVHELSVANNIEMPITENLYSIIFEGKDPRHALLELMQRDSKIEY
jgi:glycerol-3-phosphate dehydrogenase (NAD(P)+)